MLSNTQPGARFVAFRTNGDGACSLRAVFGEPTESVNGGWELKCPEARGKIAQLLGGRLGDLPEDLRPSTEFLDAVESSLWTELFMPVVRDHDRRELQSNALQTRKSVEISVQQRAMR